MGIYALITCKQQIEWKLMEELSSPNSWGHNYLISANAINELMNANECTFIPLKLHPMYNVGSQKMIIVLCRLSGFEGQAVSYKVVMTHTYWKRVPQISHTTQFEEERFIIVLVKFRLSTLK